MTPEFVQWLADRAAWDPSLVKGRDLMGWEACVAVVAGMTAKSPMSQDYRLICGTLYSSASKLVPSSLQIWRPARLEPEAMLFPGWKVL